LGTTVACSAESAVAFDPHAVPCCTPTRPPNGEALLLEGSVVEVVVATAMSALAVTALAAATGRWIVGPAGVPERVLAAVAALALLYLEPLTIAVGLAALGAAVAIHLLARRTRGEPSLAGRGGVTRQA
jgi:hypothetical protein